MEETADYFLRVYYYEFKGGYVETKLREKREPYNDIDADDLNQEEKRGFQNDTEDDLEDGENSTEIDRCETEECPDKIPAIPASLLEAREDDE